MNYQVTIRYGKKNQRYLTLAVEAPDVASALRSAADGIPEELVPEADLVELRVAPDFEKRFPDAAETPGGGATAPPTEKPGGPGSIPPPQASG